MSPCHNRAFKLPRIIIFVLSFAFAVCIDTLLLSSCQHSPQSNGIDAKLFRFAALDSLTDSTSQIHRLALGDSIVGQISDSMGGSDTLIAAIRYQMGMLAIKMAKLAYADSLLQTIKIPNSALLHGSPETYIMPLVYRCFMKATQEHSAEARLLIDSALSIAKDCGEDCKKEYARATTQLANVYFFSREYDTALPIALKARDLHEEVSGRLSEGYANALNSVAIIYENLKKSSLAEQYYKRADRIYQQLPDSTKVLWPTTLGSLGLLYLQYGDYLQANKYFRKAMLELNRRSVNVKGYTFGRVLAGYASAKLRLEDVERAKDLADSALKAAENEGGYKSLYIEAVGVLARTYFETREFKFADSLVTRALGLSPSNPDLLHLRARIQDALGMHVLAANLADSAITALIGTREKIDSSQLVMMYVTRAKLFGQEASFDAEDSLFRAVKDICSPDALSAFGNKRIKPLEEYSQYLRRRGKYDLAIGQLEELIPLRARGLDSALNELSESETNSYSRALRHSVDLLLSVALDSRTSLDTNIKPIVNAILLAKGIATEAMFRRNIWVQLSRSPTSAYREDKLRYLRDSPKVSLETLKNIVPIDNSLFVEYYEFTYIDRDNVKGGERYLAYSVGSEGVAHVYDIGPASSVNSLVEAFNGQIKSALNLRRMPDKNQTDSINVISNGLYEKVLKQILVSSPKPRLLLIAPDGPLSQIPFGGLRTDGDSYLIERSPVQYLTSGREITLGSSLHQNDNKMLLIANPDLDYLLSNDVYGSQSPAGSSCIDFRKLAQTYLPYTETEVRVIHDSIMSISSTLLLRDKATKSAFKKAIQQESYKVVHFATHGYYTPADCVDLDSRHDDGVTSLLSRSGILLAKGAEDFTGILTAREVANLDLSGVDLITLSACETGAGVSVAGEGVYGLRKAFFLAGAKDVVSTLWEIRDESSAKFMLNFYRNQTHVVPRRLQEIKVAQIETLRANGFPDHPFSWGAAFISYGDWR